MSKYNILITGTGGCGVGEGLYKALRPISDYNIFTCNSSDNSLFLFNNPQNSFIVPFAKAGNYCEVIIDICQKNNIKIVLPGSEPELITFVNNREKFETQNITILANTIDIINTFDSKWETFVKLSELHIKTPDSCLSLNDRGFFERNAYPLIVKPIIGNASKNVFIVNSYNELVCICQYLSLKSVPFIIQEYINNATEEYTISVVNDFSGDYLGSIVLKRVLAGGFSQFVECEEFSSLDAAAQGIAAKVGSKGPLNIQCRIKDDELYVFEINPRFSGTTPFRALLGFNEADTLIRKTFGEEPCFNKSDIKYGSFGVRGFQEDIYANQIKSEVIRYK